ncbi:hypothetical protein DFQ04_0947 [Algoriphagus boseongensis]|uniref:Uncharacterized protein n=1 Tax=Algoriphagus boseongensis TaxID=1442587 RepID=A0A4R6T7X1_9BACT|nr:hypothetical protein [Algoriphagus boseongensis]TDQ19130.1 hypothetical protein DFQ04_0947 [Algoriphagus boseongensis]
MKISQFPESFLSKLGQKTLKEVEKLNQLISAANQHDVREDLVAKWNGKFEELRSISAEDKALSKQVNSTFSAFLKDLNTQAGLYSPQHFQTLWMGIGMAAFGIPFGVAFSAILKNFAFIGIGIPIGLSLGIAIGAAKDNQIKKEGKLLDFK